MATLKDSNQKAIEFFMTRGSKYLKLRKGLEEHQLDVQSLGDLELKEIRKWAGIVGENFTKGIEILEQEELTWETQAKNFYTILSEAEQETDLELKAQKTREIAEKGILVAYENAQTILNLINLFKNILLDLQKSKTEAEAYSKNLSDVRKNILEAIKSDNKEIVNSESANLARFVGRFIQARDSYNEAVEAYSNSTLNKIAPLEIVPFTPEEIEEFYYETFKAIDKYSAANDTVTVAALRTNLGQMAIITGDKARELSDKAEARFKKEKEQTTKTKDKEQEMLKIRLLEDTLKKAFDIVYERAVEKYQQEEWDYPPFNQALEATEELLNNSSVSAEVKSHLQRKYLELLKDKMDQHLGKYTHKMVLAIMDINADINRLNSMSLDDPKLKEEYDKVLKKVEVLSKSFTAEAIGLVVAPHNENGFVFKFNNPKVKDFVMTEISKEIVEKLNPKKEQTAKVEEEVVSEENKGKSAAVVEKVVLEENKGKSAAVVEEVVSEENKGKSAAVVEEVVSEEQPKGTKTETEEAAVKAYLGLLEETNARVMDVNRINNLLISHNKLSNLTVENIINDVNAEAYAETTSISISKLRLELSEKRYDYLKNFGKYIIANPEVKDKKIEEIKFNANFEEFVNDRDVLIADAEVRILELTNNKPAGYEQEVANLMKFIKTQNSLISRFLVSESISRGIDIIKFQSERMAKRTALIEERKAALSTVEEQKGKSAAVVEEVVSEENKGKSAAVVEEVVSEENKGKSAAVVEEVVSEENKGKSAAVEEEVVEDKKDEQVQKDIPLVKIKDATLKFNPRHTRAIDYKIGSGDRLFKDSPKVTIRLIKNGVRVMMSQQLRERLAELNAKISLVNTKEKRMRTNQMVDANAEYQDVAFKKDHDVDFDNYSVEIRIPGKDKSQLLFSEEIPSEEIHMSR